MEQIDRWAKRQFTDERAVFPYRYVFYDINTGEIQETYDLEFIHGDVEEIGTFANRGHFQPIEDVLPTYSSDYLRTRLRSVQTYFAGLITSLYDSTISMSTRVSKKITTLNNNISAMAARVNKSVTALNANITAMSTRVSKKITTLNSGIDSMISRVKTKISDSNNKANTLTSRVSAAETNLSKYAPKSGATFSNPKATFSPELAADNNSTYLATTAQVRRFMAQYAFPPKNVKKLSAVGGPDAVTVKWSDPDDFVFDKMTLSYWKGTVVVYRTDRYPRNENDGTRLVDNTLPDWYTGGISAPASAINTTIYFGLFPYSDKSVYNRSATNRVSGKSSNYGTLDPLSRARFGLAASTDGSGSVLFGGGRGGGRDIFAEVDKYAKNNAHTTLTPLSVARYDLAASTDGNGNVLFGGGQVSSGYTATVEKYTKDGVHTAPEPLYAARSGLAASTDGNGSVLFGGGRVSGGVYSATVDKYTQDGIHIQLDPLSAERWELAASTDGNGSVLFGGGKEVYSHFANVDKYTQDGIHTLLDPLSAARRLLAASTDGNGNVLFGGGINSRGLATVDKYTQDGIHTLLDPLSTARYDLAASTDGNGNVLFGGAASGVDKYTKDGAHTIIAQSFTINGAAASTDGNGNVLFGGVTSGTVKICGKS